MNLNTVSPGSQMALPYEKGFLFFYLHEIAFFTSMGNYSKLITTDGKSFIVNMPLSKLGASYPLLYRIHNQYLINTACILCYNRGDGGEVIMKNGTKLPLARNKKKEFLKMIVKR